MPPKRSTRHVEFDTDMDRIRANRQLGKAYRAIKSARVFFITLAVLSGLQFAVLLLVQSAARAWTPMFSAIVGLSGLVFGVWVTASVRIHREPLAWCLVGAILQTINAILALSVFGGIVAVFCWAAVGAVAPAGRLMREHPDLHITARIRGDKSRRRR